MADQQNLPTADVDHLAVARNLLEGRGDQGYDAVQCHVFIDIAQSLRQLRPVTQNSVVDVQGFADTLSDDASHSPGGGRVVVIREEDWHGTLEALEQVVAQGMYAPSTVIAELRGALGR